MNAYFTYSHNVPVNLSFDNGIIILNFPPPYIDAAIFIGKGNNFDNIRLFRYCIDKSIEWAATAKQNNVSKFSKAIMFDEINGEKDSSFVRGIYGLNQPNNRRYDTAYLLFDFVILDEKGYEGPWLVMNYKTQKQLANPQSGEFFSFHEKDFARLKEMFSESYLAEIAKKENELQETRAKQNTLFN